MERTLRTLLEILLSQFFELREREEEFSSWFEENVLSSYQDGQIPAKDFFIILEKVVEFIDRRMTNEEFNVVWEDWVSQMRDYNIHIVNPDDNVKRPFKERFIGVLDLSGVNVRIRKG